MTKAPDSLPVKRKEWHFPHLVEVFYKPSDRWSGVGDRHHWIKAMMLDARLTGTNKVVLTRLALHYNLKTKLCCPSMELLGLEVFSGADESLRRMATKSVTAGARLGWISRSFRSGSASTFRFTIPKAVTRPKGVTPVSRGVTPVSQRGDSGVTLNREPPTENLESLYIHKAPLARRTPVCMEDSTSEDGVSNSHRRATYTAEQLERTLDVLQTHGIRSIGGLVSALDVIGEPISGAQIAAMCADGHIDRDGEVIRTAEEWEF